MWLEMWKKIRLAILRIICPDLLEQIDAGNTAAIQSEMLMNSSCGHCSYCKSNIYAGMTFYIVDRSGFGMHTGKNPNRRLAYCCEKCGPKRKIRKKRISFEK